MTVVSKRRLFRVVLAMLLAGAVVPLMPQAYGASGYSSFTKKHKKHHAKSAESAKAKAASARSSSTSMGEKTTRAEKKSRRSAEKKANAAAMSQNHAMAPAGEGAHNATRTEAKTTAPTHESMAGRTPPSPGMVWVNTSSKVYHKSGSRWYGKTKSGKWMTEAEAQKAGYKAAKN